MANKRFSDVSPEFGDEDEKTPAKQPSGRTLPKADPKAASFRGPEQARPIGQTDRGGKDLPCPKFVDHKHRGPEADGELPAKGAPLK